MISIAFAAQGTAARAEPLFRDAIAKAQACTVKIYGAGIGRDPGYATGVIVSADGQILTAQGLYLVGERIRIVLPDGRVEPASILRRSRPLQAALLKIDEPTPDFFRLAAEPVVHKGDWVLSMSNAFKVATGDEPLSVNMGIVSLRTRLEAKRGTQDVPYEGEVLLIDAITSNPGAPGGALVTVDGRLAGMIGKIIESKDTRTRLNYAVPADLLVDFVQGKQQPEVATTPPPLTAAPVELGIRLFNFGDKRALAYVDRVVPGSPAARAGVQPDDLILAVGDDRIRHIRDFQISLKSLRGKDPVVILVKRKQQLLRLSIPVKASEKNRVTQGN